MARSLWVGTFLVSYMNHELMSGFLRSHGWGVVCLDTHAFRLTQTPREAFGCVPDRQRGLWNISASRADVEDASIWHASFSKSAADPTTQPVVPPVEPYDDGDDEWMYDSEGTDDELEESALGGQYAVEAYADEAEPNTTLLQDNYDTGNMSGTEQFMAHEHLGVEPDHDVDPQLGTSAPQPLFKVSSKRKEVSVAAADKVADLRWPRCAVIHTSEVDIRFLQNPMEDPTVAFQNPLFQNLPPNLQWLVRFGRLNMLAQIPELGIVAVATQAGRVALLTLTRMASTKLLAFRLDAILPLHSQEIDGHRPDVPLLGIAIGPIQGRETMVGSGGSDDSLGNGRDESWRGVECSRRYRLMLTYYDHTVLSYELGRSNKATNNFQDLLLAL